MGEGMDVDIPVLAFVSLGNIHTHYSSVNICNLGHSFVLLTPLLSIPYE